jgi:sugar phosphate isomerase/epimerase
MIPTGTPTSSATPHARLSLNQATIKYASLPRALDAAVQAGYQSIGLWREPIAEVGLATAERLVQESGLRVSSLCRGGFFTAVEPAARRLSIDDNRRALDEAEAVGAPALVLVVGGLPEGSRDLVGARAAVADALGELAPHAASVGVTLAVEPLHPMYASDRAVVSTLGQALDLAEPFDPSVVGVVVDTFHVWWDPSLETEIARAGASGRIASYQVCDWKTPLPLDVLLARHYPGDGVIDFGRITRAVLSTGYRGEIEVEIFNQSVWDDDVDTVAARVAEAFASTVVPHLPLHSSIL